MKKELKNLIKITILAAIILAAFITTSFAADLDNDNISAVEKVEILEELENKLTGLFKNWRIALDTLPEFPKASDYEYIDAIKKEIKKTKEQIRSL